MERATFVEQQVPFVLTNTSNYTFNLLKMSSLEIVVTFFSWKLRYYHFQTIFFNKYCKMLPTKIQKLQSYTKQVKLRGHVAQ